MKMNYCGLDLDRDKPRLYKELKKSIAKIYQDVDGDIWTS